MIEWLDWVIKGAAVAGIIFGMVRGFDSIKRMLKKQRNML